MPCTWNLTRYDALEQCRSHRTRFADLASKGNGQRLFDRMLLGGMCPVLPKMLQSLYLAEQQSICNDLIEEGNRLHALYSEKSQSIASVRAGLIKI